VVSLSLNQEGPRDLLLKTSVQGLGQLAKQLGRALDLALAERQMALAHCLVLLLSSTSLTSKC